MISASSSTLFGIGDKTPENAETGMFGRAGMLCVEPSGDGDKRVENCMEVARFAAAHPLFLRHRKLGRVIGLTAQDLDLLLPSEAWIADDILRAPK